MKRFLGSDDATPETPKKQASDASAGEGVAEGVASPGRWRVGQQVYVRCSARWCITSGPDEIVKVGRQWGHLKRGYRFDLVSGWLDGGLHSSPGMVYTSESVWVAEDRARREWRLVVDGVSRMTRPSQEVITQAAALLGIDLKGGAR